jgi:hypothetical protein
MDTAIRVRDFRTECRMPVVRGKGDLSRDLHQIHEPFGPTGSPHNAPDVKPAIQSPIFLDRLMLALHVARVRIPENGFGANPESLVILYE